MSNVSATVSSGVQRSAPVTRYSVTVQMGIPQTIKVSRKLKEQTISTSNRTVVTVWTYQH